MERKQIENWFYLTYGRSKGMKRDVLGKWNYPTISNSDRTMFVSLIDESSKHDEWYLSAFTMDEFDNITEIGEFPVSMM